MGKKVVIISSSYRAKSNSDRIAAAFKTGAEYAGNEVTKINLKEIQWNFCRGCLACYKNLTGHCVMKDDADAAVQKVREADVLVFASPLYYYNLSGQIKAFMDRCNPLLMLKDNKQWDVYLLMTAEEDKEHTFDRAMVNLEGWVECFPNARIVGHLFAGGVFQMGDIDESKYIEEAERIGAAI